MNALANITTGSGNIAIAGMESSTTGIRNIAIGINALSNVSGTQNIAIGYQTLIAQTSATNNVAVGHQSGIQITTGSDNVILGYNCVNNVLASMHLYFTKIYPKTSNPLSNTPIP